MPFRAAAPDHAAALEHAPPDDRSAALDHATPDKTAIH
jgi:hypothetical protein